MDKQKSQNAKNLRICAKIVAWIGLIACTICLFAAVPLLAEANSSIGFWPLISLPCIGVSTAVSYYTMIVIADISETLHGKIEEPKAENTVA